MKKQIHKNYRVECRVSDYYEKRGDHKSLWRELNALADEIKRHVDGAESVDIEFDEVVVCEFCNSEWEIDEDGCPCCCDKAQEEWENDRNMNQIAKDFALKGEI